MAQIVPRPHPFISSPGSTRARHVTPLAMAGQFPTLAITKQSIDVEGIVVSLVYVSEISFYPSLASQIRK